MAELTLQALGYHDDEARIARRMHDLLQQPQDPNAPLPAWLHRQFPCSIELEFDKPQPTAAPRSPQ